MPASNRPRAITREDIAEIYDTLDGLYMDKARGEFLPGESVDSLVHKAVDYSERAESYRQIEKISDDRNLVEHGHLTRQAWRENRRRKIQETAEMSGRSRTSPILKVVK